LWHTHANGWREHRLAGHCEQTLTAHTGGVKALQFDSTKLVSGGSDGKIFVWDLRSTYTCTLAEPSRARKREGTHHINTPYARVYGAYVACAAYRCLFALEGHPRGVNTLQFDLEKIISGGEDKLVKIWSFV
jgi:WD40 repeat protein